jgi:hypothetical protein
VLLHFLLRGVLPKSNGGGTTIQRMQHAASSSPCNARQSSIPTGELEAYTEKIESESWRISALLLYRYGRIEEH